MMIVGLGVRDKDVLAFVAGFDDTAEKLETGYDRETRVLV